MRSVLHLIFAAMLGWIVSGTALAQELFIYPDKGQSAEQLEKDKYECYTWAKGQSGFDPMQVPTATAPPPEAQAGSGGALKGAAAGAVIGGAIGGITSGKVGKGALYGAGAGGLLGGVSESSKRREDEERRRQWEQQQAAQYSQKRNAYNRAYSACLEGRGYTVK